MDHSFVSITIERVDARMGSEGPEFAPAPERQHDRTPEQVCEICFQPLDASSLQSPCPGPKIPNDIASLMQ